MSESTFTSFRVMARLQTPIRMPRYGVSLDGLLRHALWCHYRCPEQATQALSDYLAFDGEVYHASLMRLGVNQHLGRITVTQQANVGVMGHDTDLVPSLFHPTKKDGTYAKVLVIGGAFKNRINKHDDYHAPFVVFDALGDARAVRNLLDFYVTNIGRDAGQGSGSVTGWFVQPLEQDVSRIDADNQPNRTLSVERYRALVGEAEAKRCDPAMRRAPLQPPYFEGPETYCVAPQPVRRIVI